jgi:hypothetical protein
MYDMREIYESNILIHPCRGGTLNSVLWQSFRTCMQNYGYKKLDCRNVNWTNQIRSASYIRDSEHLGSATAISQAITNQHLWAGDLLETLGHIVTQDILHLLQNLKLYCCVHKKLRRPRPCVTFYYMLFLLANSCQPPTQLTNWRPTPCRLS